MITVQKTENYTAKPGEVFKSIDDLGVTGMHMMRSSMMMMGSKLNLEYLSENHTGLNSKYRWTGNMLGMKMDFTVAVTKWIEGEEKIWETIGEAKLIILSCYKMHLRVRPVPGETVAELSITYERPKPFIIKILSRLFAGWYCRWCLKNMLHDAKIALTSQL